MRPLPLLLLCLLLAGCRTTAIYEPPTVPPDATEIRLDSDEMPRVLYASAWGAFAEFGWEVVSHDSDALALRVRPDGAAAALDVRAVEDEPGGSVGEGHLIARVEADAADHRRVIEEAATALASIPGRLTFR
jgi:hypothetical protein